MIILLFIIVLWYGGLFFQTFFLHRYAAHQTYTMSKTVERITFILTWVFQGSNYLSAYGYGVMHRMHHAYADTEKDPHSPKYDLNIFSMMWKTKNIYYQINKQQIEVAQSLLKTFRSGNVLMILQALGFLVWLGVLPTSHSFLCTPLLFGNGCYFQLFY